MRASESQDIRETVGLADVELRLASGETWLQAANRLQMSRTCAHAHPGDISPGYEEVRVFTVFHSSS